MIQFNKTKIKHNALYIDLQIEDASYYDDMVLESLAITSYNKYVEDANNIENSFYIDFTTDADYEMFIVGENTEKHKVLRIPNNSLNYSTELDNKVGLSKLLIITATAKGTPAMNTPCGKDVPKDTTMVYDRSILYEQFRRLMDGLNCKCNENQEFINLMLKMFSLDFAIDADDYDTAIDLWERLFSKQSNNSSKCGCNG